MGNWRTVNIVGTCAAHEVEALNTAIDCRMENNYAGLDCLSSCGFPCGLPLWGGQNISARGNMAERNYDESSVKRFLEQLAKIAPSLKVIVHVGGDYESLDVTSSVMLESGVATICTPMQKTLDAMSESEMAARIWVSVMGDGSMRQ